MQIFFLALFAYLYLPIIGIFYLLVTNESVVAGEVTWSLLYNNLIFSSIVFFPILFIYSAYKKKYIYNIYKRDNDRRTIMRILLMVSITCVLVFYFSGYDYLIRGKSRGEIRVSFGVFGFFYKWLIIYVIPLLMFLTAVISSANTFIEERKIIYLIYFIGALSALFTGYKYVVVFSFLPVFFVYFYNKSIIKAVFYIVPIVLIILTFTTKMVMSYDNYGKAFDFLIHRMTVMSAFGTIGVYNYFSDGVSLSESIKLTSNIFGNQINQFIFGIDFNSYAALDGNLPRKITFLVYPAWETALSGTSNVTVTNFGEAVYILGHYYWLYAIFAVFLVSYVIKRLAYHLSQNNIILASMFMIYLFSVILNWFNSSSVFTLISMPVFIYMALSYMMLYFIFKVKIK